MHFSTDIFVTSKSSKLFHAPYKLYVEQTHDLKSYSVLYLMGTYILTFAQIQIMSTYLQWGRLVFRLLVFQP